MFKIKDEITYLEYDDLNLEGKKLLENNKTDLITREHVKDIKLIHRGSVVIVSEPGYTQKLLKSRY